MSAAAASMAGFASKFGSGSAALPLLSPFVITNKTRASARLAALGEKSSRLFVPSKITYQVASENSAVRRSFRDVHFRCVCIRRAVLLSNINPNPDHLNPSGLCSSSPSTPRPLLSSSLTLFPSLLLPKSKWQLSYVRFEYQVAFSFASSCD
jgi:hypothetical protein